MTSEEFPARTRKRNPECRMVGGDTLAIPDSGPTYTHTLRPRSFSKGPGGRTDGSEFRTESAHGRDRSPFSGLRRQSQRNRHLPLLMSWVESPDRLLSINERTEASNFYSYSGATRRSLRSLYPQASTPNRSPQTKETRVVP